MNETLAVEIAAAIVVAICLAVAIASAIGQRRKTGRWPGEVTGEGANQVGWFGLVVFIWWFPHFKLPIDIMRTVPICLLVPAIDLALLIGFISLAVWAMSHAFLSTWHWRYAPWIAYHLLFAGLFGALVYQDTIVYRPMAWIWIIAGILGIVLAPFCARFAYQEFVLNRRSGPSSEPQGDFRLWMPRGRD